MSTYGDLSDADLLAFDADAIPDYRPGRLKEALAEHPDLMRSHLVVAMWLDGWADELHNETPAHATDGEPSDVSTHFIRALRTVAGHLRKAELVPGGVLFERTTSRE